ncbi:MAG: hypothetical protein IKI04_03215 [Bacilli bacterium]|nr:hypothetical protein [Bacilli bacterium]
MYYFKYNDTSIEKYIVNFNRDELLHLRNSVIVNCSELVHREIDSENELRVNRKITNLKKRKVGNKYHYSYDEYIYPRLVALIDMLLKHDDRAIDGINNIKEDDIISLSDKDKQNKLSNYYNHLNSMLSYELLVTIDLSEPESVMVRPKRNNKKRVKTR